MGVSVVTFGNLTDVGRVRQRNEDYYGVFGEDGAAGPGGPGRLFVVADGMGGHAAGDVASRLAVETLRDAYFSHHDSASVEEALASAVHAANEAVYRQGSRQDVERRMGTTVTALLLRGDRGYVAHVGDSRAYLIHGRTIRQLTQDHSRVAELVRKGVISEADAENHPESHMILRAVGIEERVEVDVSGDLSLRAGDVIVLCTDGLTRLVRPKEIEQICRALAPQGACERLVALANERGGPDNVTVQVVRFASSTRRRWRGTAATVVAVAGLAGGGTLWWRVTEPVSLASVSSAIQAHDAAVPASPVDIPSPSPERQLRPVARAQDTRGLSVGRDGMIAGLNDKSAFIIPPRGGAADDGAVKPLGVTEGAGFRWAGILFGSGGGLYGVVEEPQPEPAAQLVAIARDGRTARSLLRVTTGRVGERSPGVLSRLLARGRGAPPVTVVDRPAGASMPITLGWAGAVYFRLPDRLLRLQGGQLSVLTDGGFVPPATPGGASLPVAVLVVNEAQMIVARRQEHDLTIVAVAADGLKLVARLPGGGDQPPRAIAMLLPGRILLLLGDRLRILEDTAAGVGIVDLLPIVSSESPSTPAVSLVALYRSGERQMERTLQGRSEWRLRSTPTGTARDSGVARTLPSASALSADGRWWVFALDGAIYRIHVPEAVEEVARGWPRSSPEAPKKRDSSKRG